MRKKLILFTSKFKFIFVNNTQRFWSNFTLKLKYFVYVNICKVRKKVFFFYSPVPTGN